MIACMWPKSGIGVDVKSVRYYLVAVRQTYDEKFLVLGKA